jgi:CheY-like chemotaxis protein
MMGMEKRVLIVDDNIDAADLTADYLRVFGADVSVAYGGAEALAAARASLPHVIFLDIGMPGMDGYEVAQALRADGLFHDVKIIALTAWGDQASRDKSRASGFDLHLTKPANLSTLLELAS